MAGHSRHSAGGSPISIGSVSAARDSVSFEDLSEPHETRLAKSRVLTNNIRDLLQNPKPMQMSQLHIDIMPGTDEGGFNGLSPTLAMESVLGFEPSDHPVKVASLEFSIRDLYGLLSSFFARPFEHYLDGWLDTRGDQVEAFAELRTHGRHERDDKWSVRCSGPRARERAIADLAAQIVVGTGKSTMTNNWQSFRNFHEALKLRFSDRSISPDRDSSSPRTYLERALEYDAANWIARFNLGLALCRENQPQTALQHFKILEDVFTKVWTRAKTTLPETVREGQACPTDEIAFRSVLKHVKEYPECPFLVLYNRAIALANLDKPNQRGTSLEILEKIGGLLQGNSGSRFESPYDEMAVGLGHRSRTELALYALSAKANILARVLDSHCSRPAASPPDVIGSEAKQIRAITETIGRICLQEQEQHWQSLQTARAVSLTALARVLTDEAEEAEAERLLHEALAAEPGFVGAYLHLAELYLRARERLAATWPSKAEWVLKRALELSPACSRASFLLASLYAEPLVGRDEEAEALFRQLKDDPDACLRMARITAGKAQTAEALTWLHRHIVLSSTLNADGADILEQLLSFQRPRNVDQLNWRPVSAVLEAVRSKGSGPEQERISKYLARIADAQQPGTAGSVGAAAA